MSSQSAHSMTPSQYSLKILSGAEKGSVYQLTNSKVSIGRSVENDIILSDDPKISRQHIILDLEGPYPKVIDVSGKNLVLVDGEPQKETGIISGSLIKIGDIEMEFQVFTAEAVNLLEHEIPNSNSSQGVHLQPIESHWDNAPALNTEDGGMVADANADWGAAQAPPKKKNNRVRFYGIVLGIGLLFFFLLQPSGKKNKEDPLKIRTNKEILEEAKAAKERQKKLNEVKEKKGTNTRQFDEAQASYVRCFRDYRQNMYNRAIQHCQAALSLYPEHPLAERYLLLATRKRDEKTQYLLRKGRLHRERGYYKMCMSALKTVMYNTRDPKNKMFKEARQLYSECRKMAEDRY